jgi:hypothetical protein
MTSRYTNVTESIFHVNWDGHSHRFNGAGHDYTKRIWHSVFFTYNSHYTLCCLLLFGCHLNSHWLTFTIG